VRATARFCPRCGVAIQPAVTPPHASPYSSGRLKSPVPSFRQQKRTRILGPNAPAQEKAGSSEWRVRYLFAIAGAICACVLGCNIAMTSIIGCRAIPFLQVICNSLWDTGDGASIPVGTGVAQKPSATPEHAVQGATRTPVSTLVQTVTLSAPMALPTATITEPPQITSGIPAFTDAPDFTLTDMQGEPFHFDLFRASNVGKVIVLNFWQAGCPKCLDEFTSLTRLNNDYRDRVIIIGVFSSNSSNAQVARDAALNIVGQLKITYRQLIDVGTYTADMYGDRESSAPYTVVLKPNGKVCKSFTIGVSYDAHKQIVNACIR